MCREINEWLNGLLKEQLERDVKNDHAGNKATEEINMLNDELKIVNEKTPQFDILELENKFLCLELLHWCYEKSLSKKCMLSACLNVTKDCRNILLKFLGLPCAHEVLDEIEELKF